MDHSITIFCINAILSTANLYCAATYKQVGNVMHMELPIVVPLSVVKQIQSIDKLLVIVVGKKTTIQIK